MRGIKGMEKIEIKVPDIGDFKGVGIVEVYVAAGDTVSVEDPLISLESDKAVMDIPSPYAGKIVEVKVTAESKVSEGDVIALIEAEEKPKADAPDAPEQKALKSEPPEQKALQSEPPEQKAHPSRQPESAEPAEAAEPASAEAAGQGTRQDTRQSRPVSPADSTAVYHASPSVRILARELGVDLGMIRATGPKGRIRREDLYKTVSAVMKNTSAGAGAGTGMAGGAEGGLPSFEKISAEDFMKYGEIEEQPLSRIKKISGIKVHQNWVGIPHVTHFDEADVTDLEEFREKINAHNKDKLIKLSILPFIIKTVTSALKKFPLFNSSIDTAGGRIILKKYYNIGVAVNTPGGLVIPVVKNADLKGTSEIAFELKELSEKAREGKLSMSDLQGSSFSISSLGGIGGAWFTPIVNSPEAAILGLSRISVKPVWIDEKFEPRKIMPFSISYDHRIIDGAECAYFSKFLSEIITDIRKIML